LHWGELSSRRVLGSRARISATQIIPSASLFPARRADRCWDHLCRTCRRSGMGPAAFRLMATAWIVVSGADRRPLERASSRECRKLCAYLLPDLAFFRCSWLDSVSMNSTRSVACRMYCNAIVKTVLSEQAARLHASLAVRFRSTNVEKTHLLVVSGHKSVVSSPPRLLGPPLLCS